MHNPHRQQVLPDREGGNMTEPTVKCEYCGKSDTPLYPAWPDVNAEPCPRIYVCANCKPIAKEKSVYVSHTAKMMMDAGKVGT